MSNRRPGYSLMHVLTWITMLMLWIALAVPVVGALRRAAYDYREARFAIDRFEHATETLRQDVWQATTIRLLPSGHDDANARDEVELELDGGQRIVTWRTPEPGVLIREARPATGDPEGAGDASGSEPVRRWWGLGAAMRFEHGEAPDAGDACLTLHLESLTAVAGYPQYAGRPSHRTDRIVMISAARLLQEPQP